jgi:hypothetical protein
MSRTLALTLVALGASAPVFARQTPAPAAQGRVGRAPAAPTVAQRGTVGTPVAQAATPARPVARPADTAIDPTDANITIEITVIDKAAGTSTTMTRQGTITVANLNNGSVRGLSGYYGGNAAAKLDPLGLDVDAKTQLRKSGMVSVSLTVAFIPTGAELIRTSIQQQQATLFLKPGQETQVLSTGSMTGAGPAVRITAKATVIK